MRPRVKAGGEARRSSAFGTSARGDLQQSRLTSTRDCTPSALRIQTITSSLIRLGFLIQAFMQDVAKTDTQG
ncbi:hypothetical protein CBOM_07685 [Ceraceosorus bombacis]|uniref:Uncharacterized protein n=1 Tax=Ceraceosorus bombacis TaxID=401625 RepID=A0A0P1BLD2_9BASI|nr:hypothetical protein CBOM_07685 [Ceraceosorus bombacis]